MAFFAFILFIGFSTFSFAAEDGEENGEKESSKFVLGSSAFGSEAVLGSVSVDPDLVEQAEKGNVTATTELYSFYHKRGNKEKSTLWLDKLKNMANQGDMQALREVYKITGEVLYKGVDAVKQMRINLFYEEGIKQGIYGKAFYLMNKSYVQGIRENIIIEIAFLPYMEENLKKAERGDITAMAKLYSFYHNREDKEKREMWLGELKDKANKGDVRALKVVYRITGEVLSSGVNAAVRADVEFAFRDYQGYQPKVEFYAARKVHNDLTKAIISLPRGDCILSFD